MSTSVNTTASGTRHSRVLLLELDAALSPTDRDMYGNRYDTFAIATGVQSAGVACDVFQVANSLCNESEISKYARFFSARYAGVIVRINPSCLRTAPACVLLGVKTIIKHMRLANRAIWPDRTTTRHLDSKISAYRFSQSETWGISDTHVYRDAKAFIHGLRNSLGRTRVRVVKPICGSCGEGVWVCARCAIDTSVPDDDEPLFLMEMSANDHIERRTFREFVEYFLY
eukprot:gene33259-42582_t